MLMNEHRRCSTLFHVARPRRVMAHGHVQPGPLGEPLQAHLPQSDPPAVAAPAVGCSRRASRALVRPGSASSRGFAAPSGSADAVGAQGRNAGSHRADAALNSTRRQAGDPGNEQRAVRADRQGAVGGEEPGLVFVEGGQDSSPAPVSLPQGRIGVTEATRQDGTRTVSPRRAGVPQTAEAILSV